MFLDFNITRANYLRQAFFISRNVASTKAKKKLSIIDNNSKFSKIFEPTFKSNKLFTKIIDWLRASSAYYPQNNNNQNVTNVRNPNYVDQNSS